MTFGATFGALFVSFTGLFVGVVLAEVVVCVVGAVDVCFDTEGEFVVVDGVDDGVGDFIISSFGINEGGIIKPVALAGCCCWLGEAAAAAGADFFCVVGVVGLGACCCFWGKIC